MYKHISKNNKLLVVSDTGMAKTIDGVIKAFGPVVTELNHLLLEFDEITWIGFHKKKEHQNKSYIDVNNSKIKIILLEAVGGRTLYSKIKILFFYPKMIFIILSEILKHNYIHSRAPSNPAFITMFLSYFFRDKIFWHKYAGSWIDNAPFFYKLQRKFLLLLLRRNNFITINGNYSKNSNIIPFENPCLDEEDRVLGLEVINKNKLKNKIIFCFVGALNQHKGVDIIIEAFKKIQSEKIGDIHFIGDSEKKSNYIQAANKLQYNTIFHGYLPKDEIREIYQKSHFILLPSKSEGFPKVIGEAMNYGCIPIVSNVSCIGDYIKNNENGFLIEPNTSEILKNKIIEAIRLETLLYNKWIEHNYLMSEKFTYSYYNKRILTEIFK